MASVRGLNHHVVTFRTFFLIVLHQEEEEEEEQIKGPARRYVVNYGTKQVPLSLYIYNIESVREGGR
jgi:hypothetical protein